MIDPHQKNAMDSLLRYIESTREDLRPEHNALIDAMVMLELAKRGASQDLKIEMRLVAAKHRQRSPYMASLLKLVADLLETSTGIIPFPPKPHCQENKNAPKRH